MIKLLIVGNSGFMRVAIRKMLEQAPTFQIVGETPKKTISLAIVQRSGPDIVIVDLEKSDTDGIQDIAQILNQHKRLRLMILLTPQSKFNLGTEMRDLDSSKINIIPKSSDFAELDIIQIGKELKQKIYHWAENVGVASVQHKVDLIAIGCSTGGPQALPILLKKMGELPCPTVIAQHMPSALLNLGFAEHLKLKTQLQVIEAKQMTLLEEKLIVVIPGGTNGIVYRNPQGKLALRLWKGGESSISPSADTLLESSAKVAKHPLAVILTGMGNDGTIGAKEFCKRKYPVLVQTPSSCAVDGMPSSVIEAKAATQIMSLEGIGEYLSKFV